MKVLSVICRLDPAAGGPTVSVSNSAIARVRAGIETTLAFGVDPAHPESARAAMERLQANGVVTEPRWLISQFRRKSAVWGISPALARWVLAVAADYDIVHCHGAWQLPPLVAIAARRRAGTPIVLTPHGSLTDYDVGQTPTRAMWVGKKLLKPMLIRGFDCITAASELEGVDSIPPELRGSTRCEVVPHAVYDEQVPLPTPRRRPLSPGALTAGFIGRFAPMKNLEIAIRALAATPPGVRLVVAGDGGPDYVARLRKLAQDLGVAQRIEWLGFVGGAAKEAFFAGIDVLLVPSLYESFGMSAAEALARSVPVLLAPKVGVATIVAHHGCGEIIPLDPAPYGAALGVLLANPERLAQYAVQARYAAAAEFSFAAHAAKLRDVYQSLLVPADYSKADRADAAAA